MKHYKLLTNAGLIDSHDISSLEEENFVATSLTWQGAQVP
ncbi:DUF2513 domain-containing protein [Rodentibacter ratti]|nr:DUF2513 domain-containing protein [Rodentibacter ratti]